MDISLNQPWNYFLMLNHVHSFTYNIPPLTPQKKWEQIRCSNWSTAVFTSWHLRIHFAFFFIFFGYSHIWIICRGECECRVKELINMCEKTRLVFVSLHGDYGTLIFVLWPCKHLHWADQLTLAPRPDMILTGICKAFITLRQTKKNKTEQKIKFIQFFTEFFFFVSH